MKNSVFLIIVSLLSVCFMQDDRTKYFPKTVQYVESFPSPDKFWIFVLAGQSNMAGRGLVEPEDTVPDTRIFSLSNEMRWVYAKEPLQQYQPTLTGLGPGLAFAKSLVTNLDEDICIGLIPCAVGGSSVDVWLNDSLFNNVRLKSNFTDKVKWARKYGTIKGVIWHQGEADATAEKAPQYQENLQSLFAFFRKETGNDTLPVIIGELGIFEGNKKNNHEYLIINHILSDIAMEDPFIDIVSSCNLKPTADNVHFDGESQRIMGKRYAHSYLTQLNHKNK